MGRKTVCTTASIAAAVLLASAAGAKATWSPPATLWQGSLGGVVGPVLAGSPTNGSTVAWTEDYYSLIARRIGPDGKLGPRHRLTSSMGDVSPKIAVAQSGTTVALWSDARGRILARRMTRHGKLGRVHRVGSWPAASNLYDIEFDLGLDSHGDATIVWSTSSRPDVRSRRAFAGRAGGASGGIGLHARVLKATGRLGHRVDVRLSGGESVDPRVAVAPTGRAALFWNLLGRGAEIHTATINRRGRLGPVTGISGTGKSAVLGDVTVDPRGDPAVAWRSSDGGTNSIVVRRIVADGSPDRDYFPVTSSASSAVNDRPRLVTDAAGNVTVVWLMGSIAFPNDTIESRRIDLNGNFTPLTNVSSPLGDIALFEVTVDRTGNQTVSWTRNGPYGSGVYALQLRRIGRDGSFGAIDTVASGTCRSGGCFDLPSPKLLSDARGVVTAVWLEPQPGLGAAIKLSRYVPG